jgi:aryl-alcohol dehydrogenase-like predicted oxidoreductase
MSSRSGSVPRRGPRIVGQESQVSRRAVTGTSLATSSIAFTVDPPPLATPSADRRTVALLQGARARGVTTFDVAGARHARRAEHLLSTAFPADDPDLVVLLGRSVSILSQERGDSRSVAETGDLESRLRASIEESAERLHPQKVGLVEWDHTSDPPSATPPVAEALTRLRTTGVVKGWVLAIPPDGSLSTTESEVTAGGPGLFSGTLSALETRLLFPMADRAAQNPTGFFARGPFGSGRLDGSRFDRSLADRPPGFGPSPLRELQREFDPVLRLGFLTEGRRRTLAQASLGFVLRSPWVCSVVVPLPLPERLDELLAAEQAPPFSDEEAQRVLKLAP